MPLSEKDSDASQDLGELIKSACKLIQTLKQRMSEVKTSVQNDADFILIDTLATSALAHLSLHRCRVHSKQFGHTLHHSVMHKSSGKREGNHQARHCSKRQ